MTLQIVNALAPLGVLVALGAVLLKTGFMSTALRQGLDRLVYWVALPALIVRVLAQAPPAADDAAVQMTVVLCGATLAAALIAWAAAWIGRVPRASVGVLIQAAFRGNLAFVGLPVIALASHDDSVLLAKAAFVFAPTVVLYNVLGVVGLVASQQRLSAGMPRRMAVSLATNPLLLACVVGMALGAWGRGLPTVVGTSLELLGKPAGPLALLSLGGVLVSYPVRRHLGLGLVTALFKCGLVPLLTWVFAGLMGLDGPDMQVVMIFSACPTAVASYVLATQLKGDAGLAAAAIVISTLLSGLALGGVLILTG